MLKALPAGFGAGFEDIVDAGGLVEVGVALLSHPPKSSSAATFGALLTALAPLLGPPHPQASEVEVEANGATGGALTGEGLG